jgi:hypothetical protein
MRIIFRTLIDIFVINILFRFLSPLNLQYIIFAVNKTEEKGDCLLFLLWLTSSYLS